MDSIIKKNFWSVATCLIALFIGSCSSDEDEGPDKSTFKSIDVIGSNRAVDIRTFLGLAGITVEDEKWKYDVDLYRLSYATNVDDTEITASALMIIPQTEEELSMISFHRGTITANREAPSELLPGAPITILYSGLSSLGTIAVFPDMIGFGTSAGMTHPYYVRDINAATVRDAIIAAYEFVEQEKVSFDGELYLAGYSQGGYITMTTQESLEQDPIGGLELKATFPAAGAYDVKGLQEYFFTLDTYEQPYYLAYVGLAYMEYFSLDLQLTDIFNDPFPARIPGLFNGSLNNTSINEQLSHEIDVLLTPEFLQELEVAPKYQPINNLFSENGLLDWSPSVPTYLYHGDADTFIPIQNSIDTYNQLLENGASEENLTLTIIQGADHAGGVIPYANDVAIKLIELIED